MTSTASAGQSCLFCRIVARTIPAEIVYEDPATVAFLDVNPAARGHVLVVPRAHAAQQERDVSRPVDHQAFSACIVAIPAWRFSEGRAVE